MPQVDGGTTSPAPRPVILSRREAEIARWIAEGYSNAAIAEKLGIRASTVSAHIASAKIKLRVRNRAQLAAVFTLACAQRASAMLLGALTLGPQDCN